MNPNATAELTQELSQVALYLHRIASFIDCGHFIKLLFASAHRFNPSAKPELVNKLRHDFLYQLEQGLPLAVSRDMRPLSQWNQDQTIKALRVTATSMRDLAHEIVAKHSAIKLMKKDMAFRVEQGKDAFDVAYALFNQYEAAKALSPLTRQLMPFVTLRSSYQRNTAYSLSTLMEAWRTLLYQTGNKKFDALLKTLLMKDADYFTNGYPHDLLVYDAAIVRDADGQSVCIAVKDDYCSTTFIQNSTDSIPSGTTTHTF